jgi:hypothetical protein
LRALAYRSPMHHDSCDRALDRRRVIEHPVACRSEILLLLMYRQFTCIRVTVRSIARFTLRFSGAKRETEVRNLRRNLVSLLSSVIVRYIAELRTTRASDVTMGASEHSMHAAHNLQRAQACGCAAHARCPAVARRRQHQCAARGGQRLIMDRLDNNHSDASHLYAQPCDL